jgi:hypothetical protein
MTKAINILKFSLLFLFLAMILSCAPAKKNTYYQKKKKTTHLDSERVGRNKYFFSPSYQKKLSKSYKKK